VLTCHLSYLGILMFSATPPPLYLFCRLWFQLLHNNTISMNYNNVGCPQSQFLILFCSKQRRNRSKGKKTYFHQGILTDVSEGRIYFVNIFYDTVFVCDGVRYLSLSGFAWYAVHVPDIYWSCRVNSTLQPLLVGIDSRE
jgi:hypothetical protein